MTRFALAVGLVLLAPQAIALSCLHPDVARSFLEAQAAGDRYIVLLGRFDFDDADLLHGVNDPDASDPAPITARFTGTALTEDGFTAPHVTAVTLQQHCAGPWCGALFPGRETLAFLRLDFDRPVLEVDPCPQWVFVDPSLADIERVETCMSGGPCAASSEY